MASTTQPKPQPPVQRASAPVQAAPQMAVPAASAPSEEGEEETVTPDGKRIRSSPLVRRLVRESGVDLVMIQCTGAAGRISKKDVLAAISAVQTSAGSVSSPERAATPTPPTAAQGAMVETALPRERIYFGHYEVQPMSVMRHRIADHMVLSKRVSPHVYSIDEADMTRIVELRNRLKEEFERQTETRLTFMP